MPKTAVLLAFMAAVFFMPMGCGNGKSDAMAMEKKPTLLIYCGITMVKPMREIADAFERDFNCKVIITQGGSEDLYQSLKASRQGDLYLPGSESYRKRHLKEGLLSDCAYLGYNQAALMVQTGNPKGITGELKWLLSKELAVAVGNPDSCSIGKISQKILDKAGIFKKAAANSFTLAADSRHLNKLLRDRNADLILNWRATGFFEENRQAIEVIDFPQSVPMRKKLLLNLLTFSRHPTLARRFMAAASSPAGRAVFKEYGFLEEKGPE